MPILTEKEVAEARRTGYNRLPLLLDIYTGPKETAPRVSYPCPWDMAMVAASGSELEIAVITLEDAIEQQPAHAERYAAVIGHLVEWMDYRVAKFDGETPKDLRTDADYIRELQAFDTWVMDNDPVFQAIHADLERESDPC